MQTQTDRIEKQIVLKAPRSRVWRALTDAAEFGAWFGIVLEGAFTPGRWTRGRMSDPDYAHFQMAVRVEKIEPERRFTYRWHPYPSDPEQDYSEEPTTLVEFTLEDAPGGTRLRVVESGFDRLPKPRRDEAFPKHEGGWVGQLENIEEYLREHP